MERFNGCGKGLGWPLLIYERRIDLVSYGMYYI